MKIRIGLIAFAVLTIGSIFYNQQIVESWMRYSLRSEDIVVSLTTTPYRINHIASNLNRILEQNVSINKVYLSIPYQFKRDNLEYIIPDWLEKNPKISILRTQDYGPGTKLLGMLSQTQLSPNTIIITLDDDVIYPINTVLHLAYYAQQNPDNAVGIMGAEPIYDAHGKVALNSEYGLRRISQTDVGVKILQGWAGIAYRAKFFDNKIFEIENTIAECKDSDDVFFSFYLAKNHIQRLVLKTKYMNHTMLNKESLLANDSDALFKQDPGPTIKHRACISYLHGQYPAVDF